MNDELIYVVLLNTFHLTACCKVRKQGLICMWLNVECHNACVVEMSAYVYTCLGGTSIDSIYSILLLLC